VYHVRITGTLSINKQGICTAYGGYIKADHNLQNETSATAINSTPRPKLELIDAVCRESVAASALVDGFFDGVVRAGSAVDDFGLGVGSNVALPASVHPAHT
jgi:hypothetical protein